MTTGGADAALQQPVVELAQHQRRERGDVARGLEQARESQGGIQRGGVELADDNPREVSPRLQRALVL